MNRSGRSSLPAAWNRGATPALIDEKILANTEAAPAHRHAASVARDPATAPGDATGAMGCNGGINCAGSMPRRRS
jgi:hypothetical protein